MAKPVIVRSFLVIGENGVGLLNFFEAIFCIRFSASVGVVLSSEATEGIFEVTRRC